MVVPAYNESECIADTLGSLLASDHPIEIVVVDDGSTDGTADIVEAVRDPRVRVIRQANAGKAAALNTGIAHARHELIVMMDGDTVFEPGTVRRLVQPFADPRVGAVAGNAKIVNRRGLIARWQHLEYVVGFNIDRRVYDTLHCMPTVPGAVGAFRRRALAAGRRGQRRHAGRGHRPHHRPRPGRLARGLRAGGPRLDRGPRDGSASCGCSATAGATGPCSRCGSTGTRWSSAARPAAWAGWACSTSRCSRSCCRSWRRWSTSSCSTG